MTKHPLPDAALESDIAILGRKGGGKTITSKGIAERLIRAGHRVLILDPLGGWWGLKSSADGQSPGLSVAIFGGEHADIDIVPEMAEPLARIIAIENLPAIIDIADMKQETQRRFLLAFLGELRTVNRDPLTVILEEADVFAPQQPQTELAKELHGEIDWLARRGRARGFRLITVCQRPARLSKDVLTQATTLIAHVLPSPQDRDAVKAWVEGNGDKDKAKEVFATLGKLHVGEAWTWYADPHHGFLKRIQYPMITTFDSTRTPKAGEKRIEAKELAQIDMGPIRAALAKARMVDGKVIVAREVGDTMEIASSTMKEELAREYQRGYGEGHMRGREDAAAREIVLLDHLRSIDIALNESVMLTLATAVGGIRDHISKIINSAPSATPSREPAEDAPGPSSQKAAAHGRGTHVPRKAKTDSAGGATGDRAMEPRPGADTTQPIQAIVDAIAWWGALSIATPSQVQVAFLAGYSPKSGTWRTYISRAKSAGLITAANKTLRLTQHGRSIAVMPESAPSFSAVRKRVMDQISEPLQKIMAHLIECYPAGATSTAIARAAGYAESGSFRTYMSRVRSLGLITKEDGGRSKAARFMFGRDPDAG